MIEAGIEAPGGIGGEAGAHRGEAFDEMLVQSRRPLLDIGLRAAGEIEDDRRRLLLAGAEHQHRLPRGGRGMFLA